MTSRERAQRVAEVVKSALERDASEWPAFLDEACGTDSNLRAEVESLLDFQSPARDFIEQPAVQLAAGMLADVHAFSGGERVGQYEVLSLIGSGGMGEVYLAQDTELGRNVALKFIKRGFGSQNFLRHFRAEERILAGLNHPNIAQLYGAGMTADGIPYFVMEYVDGAPLDKFSDERGLGLQERLRIFGKVCAAVACAHQNLVIHRDLKPANIRVTTAGEPKLLDFGIAKLFDPDATDALEQTMTLAGVMTPEYASPEQVRGESITTASDVYSLGVVLYQLLTGERPYRTSSSTPNEIARAVTDQEPERPSTAVGRGQSASGGSEISPSKPDQKSLRGDLDNIVLMAMRKEPARRYASVAQFSEDIVRYLDGLPVIARKDTVAYRASKFVRRNRVAVAAAAIVTVAILAGLVVALSQAKEARRERDLAQHERINADASNRKAQRINAFLQRMLSFSNQSVTSVSPVAQNKNVTVNEMLDQITPQVEKELANEPEVRAQILRTIGNAYASQGIYDRAEKTFRSALATQVDHFGEKSSEAAATMLELGVLSYRQHKLEEAAGLLTKAAKFYDETSGFESPASNPGKRALAKDYLGVVKFYLNDQKGAIALLEEARQIIESAPLSTVDQGTRAFVMSDLGGALVYSGQIERGEPLLREAIAEYRQASKVPRWELGVTLLLLGTAEAGKNHPDEAGHYLQEAEEILRSTLGDRNSYLGHTLNEEARLLLSKNDLSGAESKAREGLEVAQSTNPPSPLHAIDSQLALGDVFTKSNRYKEAENHYHEALNLLEHLPHPQPSALVDLKVRLSKSLLTQGRLVEAEEIARSACDDAEHAPDSASLSQMASTNLAAVLEAKGKAPDVSPEK